MPAHAAIYTADSASLAAVFAQARGGDTIQLSGSFGAQSLRDRRFAGTLTIDARRATFNNRLSISNVDNLHVIGGTFGTTDTASTWQNGFTIGVFRGSNVQFSMPTLISNGAGRALGISLRETRGAGVQQGSFDGFRMAVGMRNVAHVALLNNRVTGQTSDGFNIVSSHFVNVDGNSCSSPDPSPGAHPDCVQLWSLAGEPVQSDINITGNRASGYMQGFTSFDGARGGGLRINISGNYLNTSYPLGIACDACVDSRFVDNTVLTAPGARWQTRISVKGTNNVIENNRFGAGPALTGQVRNLAMGLESSAGSAAAVPEPLVWLQLLLGFGLIGTMARRRAAVATA